MLKINIKKDYIPIPFVDEGGKEKFELRFYKTDENIQRILDYNNELEETTKEDENAEPTLEEQKARDKKIIDATLGEGSFDKMYDLSDSLMNVRDYYVEICIGLLKELGHEQTSKALEKYRRG